MAAAQVNNLQLILLAVEGVALCCICTIWMWVLSQRVTSQRYSKYCVFMVIPSALVRRLALRKLRLTDEDDEDDDEDLVVAAHSSSSNNNNNNNNNSKGTAGGRSTEQDIAKL
jgi:hypothetical protein